MPLPRAEKTLAFDLPVDDALRKINEWSALPLPLSASCWLGDRLYVRLSGASSAVSAAQGRLGGEETEDAPAFWRAIREQQHDFFQVACRAPLWRLSVRSTAPYADLGGNQVIEWGGALRWICAEPNESGERLRAWAKDHGGHATLFRSADKSMGAFHALSSPLLALHQRLKTALDPVGIFNRRRMYAEF
jgi:glycolate oxidase FAD binding subunit